MDGLREQLVSLRDISEKLAWAERRRAQLNIIGKTVSLINKLEAIEKKLQSPQHTSGDLVKHMKLLTELRLLYRTDELQSPVNCIKREMELTEQLYEGILKAYKSIIATYS